MSIIKVGQAVCNFVFNEPIRDYGYSLNIGEGVGSLMMMGSRVAKAKVLNALDEDTVLTKIIGVVSGVAIGLLTAPLTIVGALVRGISERVPHSFEAVDDLSVKRTSPYIVDQVYSLTEQLGLIANKHGLKYWGTGGTLLGAERQRGMIFWDDDGDFAMRETDLPKLLSMKGDLEAIGITLFKGPIGLWKLKYTQEKRQELFKTNEEADLDMVLVRKSTSGRWVSANDGYRNLYPREVFLDEEISELKQVPFGPKGLTIPVPKNATRFLKNVYGEDCLKYGIRTHTHNGFFGLKIGSFEFNPVLTKYKMALTPGYAQGSIWKDS